MVRHCIVLLGVQTSEKNPYTLFSYTLQTEQKLYFTIQYLYVEFFIQFRQHYIWKEIMYWKVLI